MEYGKKHHTILKIFLLIVLIVCSYFIAESKEENVMGAWGIFLNIIKAILTWPVMLMAQSQGGTGGYFQEVLGMENGVIIIIANVAWLFFLAHIISAGVKRVLFGKKEKT